MLEEKYIETNGIELAYADSPGDGPTVILTHGLTANLHSYAGLIKAGLGADEMRVILVDLRGRGRSDKPDSGYSMADHAADIIGLMDGLGIEKAVVGGHSFGGLLTIYMANHFPERIEKMIIIDAGKLHPNVRELIKPSLERLGRSVPSLDEYLAAMRKTPYYHDGFWVDELDEYYTADVEQQADGSVLPRSKAAAIAEAADKALDEDWDTLMQQATQPAIMIHAPDGFGPSAPAIITDEGAKTTVEMLGNCTYKRMTGNHITMLFGHHANAVVQVIRDFVND